MTVEAFPLNWPAGYPRKSWSDRKRSTFKVTFGAEVQRLLGEIRMLKGSYPVISTNVPIRKDGLPYSLKSSPSDPGVAIYFLWREQQRVFACDQYERVEDNLHAIVLSIEALRGLERWGVSQMLERTFSGFKALPAPEPEKPKKSCWEVLEVHPQADLDFIEAVYKFKLKKLHPDSGGDHERMVELNCAMEEARLAKRGSVA
jgi:hypothetical protein